MSAGRIITMFSDDTNQIRNFIMQMCTTIVAPLQIAVCLYFVYGQVGSAMFVGIGYTMFALPLTGVLFRLVFRLRDEKMTLTDMRIKLINEVLSGIRIIKYYAWEGAFIDKITEIRKKEVSILMIVAYTFHTVLSIFLIGAPQMQLALIFITFISQGNQLDGARAFTTLALFGIMLAPFVFLPIGLQQFNQSRIAMIRIVHYLGGSETQEWMLLSDNPKSDIALEFKDLSVSWEPTHGEEAENAVAERANNMVSNGDARYQQVTSTENANADILLEEGAAETDKTVVRATNTLRNLNLKVMKGQLVAIVGPVGSGKSSILSCILGELFLNGGELTMTPKLGSEGKLVPLSIAYCDQRAWIVNATVKDNILFGKTYDEEKFHNSIYSACMEDDLKILSAGVETEIGERGINLSGGQKARVSLARAVYNDADLYLLDDPLSAVDAHVGRHIFAECIKGSLKGKTRLFVTHHLHVLPECDFIVILDKDGTIKASGSYEEITASGIDVSQYIGNDENETTEDGKPAVGLEPAEAEAASDDIRGEVLEDVTVAIYADGEDNKTEAPQLTAAPTSESVAAALITIEERQDGSVAWSTYVAYMKLGGVWIFWMSVLAQVISQVLIVYSNFWLSDWGEETTIDNLYYRRDMTYNRALYWYRGYVGLQMAGVFFLTLSRCIFNYYRSRSITTLHHQLLNTILYLPVSFFDVTPVGRIVNRFSQDTATVDDDLPLQVMQLITTGVSCLGYFGAIAGSTKGTLLLLGVPLVFMYRWFQQFFNKSNTAIARLEAVSRSPIYADFSQTLSGTITIRAYREQTRFIATLEEYANKNTVPGVLQQVAGQWLAIRLDFLGALIMFFMGALTVSLKDNDFIPAKYLGLGLSYSIQLTAVMKLLVRTMAMTEALFNSVERIKFYADMVDKTENRAESLDQVQRHVPVASSENAGDIEMNTQVPQDIDTVPLDWPQHGHIRFEQVSMRYRDGPLVLKNVSFDVNAKEKIGIAGRTGCGKSSLMVALFRIEELSGGKIYIDDVDISTLSLKTLRSKLCIIPQDPVMFSASVRFNLDPFSEFSDEEVWEVLRSVNMSGDIEQLPNKLNEMVSEGGDNFSAGQRQVLFQDNTGHFLLTLFCFVSFSLLSLCFSLFALLGQYYESPRFWLWMRQLLLLIQKQIHSFKR
jgi:ATP-binding cassette subfamily C (CFTR/MRP) protein 1